MGRIVDCRLPALHLISEWKAMSEMKLKDDEFSLSKIRGMDLAGFIEQLGFPVAARKKNDTDYWYRSPLREERTASFHVNRVSNEWFDFGLMAGGNPVDFCLRFFDCGIGELLAKFDASFSPHRLPVFDRKLQEGQAGLDSKLTVKEVRSLYAYPLKNYLHERSIPVIVADHFCKEISYEINGRSYYGIGFQNDAGGWEIRNRNFKQSSAPKDITCLGSGAASVHVFEGFMDFLSYRALHPYEDQCTVDFVVLNGAGFFDRALPFLEAHSSVHLWLDRDVTGLAYTKYALSLGSRFVDESGLYEKFKDLNDWLRQKGEVKKPGLRLGGGLRSTG
ncbi:toprim domain-containing protein [Mucilaginibacter aquaedulcis]|uniref:toprim domain-containing protein n=1 Tax=Mucilaginibacter aquaedulcis TaxID=1187081 RepID=UPI0025B2B5C1|nr:toprim domain-containing protein [Mucilaginibacter aquaedulcis]MDN3548795.1 toprim domain-containing protein [Mucilaginibacter aquaedulcis]